MLVVDKQNLMTKEEVDAYFDSIKSSKPPFLCPYIGCLKKYRKIETFQQHLHAEHVASAEEGEEDGNRDKVSNEENKKQPPPAPSSDITTTTTSRRTRKPTAIIKASEPTDANKIILNDPPPPPPPRYVEFKYKNVLRTLFADTPLPVSIINAANRTRVKSVSKGGKRRCAIKSSKPAATHGLVSMLNLKLPQPAFCIIDHNKIEYKEPLDINTPYFRYLDSSVEDDEQNKIDYDMDEEDSLWLEQINRKRKNKRLLDVTPDIFELLMDRLEKESFFQSQYKGHDEVIAIDEDAVCCICNDGECQNSNAILFCDMCNLAVHQECYGVPYIPEGQWLCRRCMHSPSCAVDCVLCPNKGGAFKQTDDNRWAHVICAIWIPEVCFANTVFLEPIDSISLIPQARWRLNCYICGIRNSGACIQCHKSNCYLAFHVTCAQQAGLYMKMEAIKERTPQGVSSIVKKTAYCYNHAPVKTNNIPLYSSSDEGNGKSSDNKRKQQIKSSTNSSNSKVLETGHDCRLSERSFIPVVSIPTIPIERLSKISELVSFPRRNKFLLKLYAYWKLKRQSRNGVPLLRRLHVSNVTVKADIDKPKWKKRDKSFQYRELRLLRRDFERVRLLLEQLKKRERLKMKIAKEDKAVAMYVNTPFKCFLLNILERIIEKDTNGFFLEPVNAAEVPDYLTFIEKPMDLGTIKKRVEDHGYTSFDDFERDLHLVVDNCKHYNDKETIWHKAAVKLEASMDWILKKNRPYLVNFDQSTGLHVE